MKNLFCLLLFSISAISVAQDPRLFENDWYLYSIQATDLSTEIIVSEIEPPISPYLSIQENLDFNGEGACNSFNGVYEAFGQNYLSASTFFETGEDCGIQIYNSLEEQLFSVIPEMHYTLTEDSNGFILTISTVLMGYAVFKSYPLSTSDFQKNKFQLYPNPAKDKLFISATNIVSKIEIKIFNIKGKILNTQNLELENQNSTDISQLSQGIYFLNIQDENGNIEMKKFIKE